MRYINFYHHKQVLNYDDDENYMGLSEGNDLRLNKSEEIMKIQKEFLTSHEVLRVV